MLREQATVMIGIREDSARRDALIMRRQNALVLRRENFAYPHVFVLACAGKRGTASRTQTGLFGFHAGGNTRDIRYFRRAKPYGIGCAGSPLFGCHFAGLSARRGGRAEGHNQHDATGSTK